MFSQHETSFVRRILLLAGLVALVVGLEGRPAVAADPLKQIDASLQWVPEDAAYYSAMLRNGEQIDAIAKSRAWKSLMDMPAVKQGLRTFWKEFEKNENSAQVREAWENPEVQTAVALLGDMFSREVFVCGDAASADCVELLQQIVGAMRYGPLVLQVTGQARDLNPQERNGRLLLSTLAESVNLIKVANTVVGFRVKDTQRAKDALVKLEAVVNMASMALPQLAGRVKREKVAGHEYITISLDGKMVPWDQLPMDKLEEMEAEDGDAKKVIDKLKTLKLVIALGLRNDYLLLAVGPSTEYLAKLGQGKSLTARPEFKPLEKFSDRRLVSISYLSKAMAAKVLNKPEDVDNMVELLESGLESAEKLDDKQKEQIRKDAAALAKDVKRLIPVPGAILSFDFATDRGVEGYVYNWGKDPNLGTAKPLGLLQHVDGSPLLMLVGRGKVSVADYDMMVRWLKVGYRYVEEYVLPNMQPSEREQFDKAVKAFRPLLERFNETNRSKLLPALADGQVGLTVDAKLKSKQFVKSLPATPQVMPMAEPGLLLGVSNAELLRKAMADYREIVNAAVDALREVSPTDVPQFKIPEPEVTKTSAGTLYWYPLPDEWGVTGEVQAVMGLSDQVAVVGVTKDQAERLLKTTPFVPRGVLASADRPLIGAVVLDWAGVVTAATPWVEFAAREIIKEKFGEVKVTEKVAKKPKTAEKAAEKPAVKDKAKKADAKQKASPQAEIMAQVHTVLKVLKVIRTVSAESYREGDAVVSHTMVEIRDIE